MYDPSLMAPVNVGGMVAQGLKEGQKTREQALAQGAMAALVQNPNNPRALAALAQVDPAAAMQFQQQQAQQAHEQLAQHQDSIIKGAEIIRQFNPKDQASYSAALQAAQQAGIDVSQVPQQYNPQYVDGIVKLADAFKPQPNGQLVPFTPGGGVARLNPQTHQLENLVVPNPGGQQTGSPAQSGAVTATGPNGQKVQFNPQSGQWEPIGGQTPQASGGFPR